MSRRRWLLLAIMGLALGCGSEASPDGSVAGAGGTHAGVGAAGSNQAGAGGAGTAGTSAGAPHGGASGETSAGNGGNAGVAGAVSMSGASGMAGAGGSSNPSTLPKRVLLYHFGTLAIPSLPAQITLFKTRLETWGYEVEASTKPEDLGPANLMRFGAVGMINTCFEPFGVGKQGEAQTAALAAFVESGGGLFGTHCASVTFQAAEPPNPYNTLIGGRGGHGFFDGKSSCRSTEAHVTTALLPATFDFDGNLDNADYLAADSKVLVKCKWSGGDMKDTAVSWYRTPGKGRVFYTNFAKIDADLNDATFGEKHIWLGLGWVLGR